MEERLLEAYVGEKSEKIINDKYNWVAALVGQMIGPIWFFYRKAPILGFLFWGVTYIVGSMASAIEFEEGSYIMFIIYLLTANKLYLWDAKRKIYKIEANETLTDEEKIEAATKKGGVSPAAAVIYVLLFIAYIIYYIYLSMLIMEQYMMYK